MAAAVRRKERENERKKETKWKQRQPSRIQLPVLNLYMAMYPQLSRRHRRGTSTTQLAIALAFYHGRTFFWLGKCHCHWQAGWLILSPLTPSSIVSFSRFPLWAIVLISLITCTIHLQNTLAAHPVLVCVCASVCVDVVSNYREIKDPRTCKPCCWTWWTNVCYVWAMK